MKQPKTTNQEVLYVAIKQGQVSLLDFPYLAGFRTRVSNLKLKYKVDFKTEIIKDINKFGRTISYHNHIISDIENAKSIYKLMTRI